MQNKKVRQKALRTLSKNNIAPTSKQQAYINTLINGKLNYPIGNCLVDILIGENVVFEYDGGGHNLSVKLGTLSEDEFKRKEMKREMFLRSQGFKIIRLISREDLIPSDDKLFKIIELSMEHFNNSHSWIVFDIDRGVIICSLGTETYNFGELRRIY